MTNRSGRARIARETLDILEEGRYATAEGNEVELRAQVDVAVAGTVSIPAAEPIPLWEHEPAETSFEVRDETTLACTRRLVDEGRRVIALNFASAKNPGGGFLGGSQAQEESLARASALHACIHGDPMYQVHRDQGDPLYTSHAIYSPDVPVFRDDADELLDAPYLVSFITSPAVNAGVVLERDRSRHDEVRAAMDERVRRVLGIAAARRYPAVVLGAWGCGVFRNDPEQVAELFDGALRDAFRGAFERVTFAVLDGSRDRCFISPFERRFGAEP